MFPDQEYGRKKPYCTVIKGNGKLKGGRESERVSGVVSFPAIALQYAMVS